MNGHKHKKTTIAPLSIYARNTLCLSQYPYIFPILSILPYCSELPSSIATKLQIRSDRTVRFLDFQQTDFNDFAGVGTSTSCFCLNYHNFPTYVSFLSTFKATTTTSYGTTEFQRLTSYVWILTIPLELTQALFAFASIDTAFSDYIFFFPISKAPETTKSHRY